MTTNRKPTLTMRSTMEIASRAPIFKKMPMRLRAEEKLQRLVEKNLAQHLGECDDKELLHELQVNMVELATQNEELKTAHENPEKAKDRYQAL